MPSVNTKRLWFGIFTTLWTVARVPILVQIAALRRVLAASRWATTRIVFSSPSDWISWIELSRPTVRGRTACGKRTVSLTGRTGYDLPLPSVPADLLVGLITLTNSFAIIECSSINFLE
jgi:hypothetical protein